VILSHLNVLGHFGIPGDLGSGATLHSAWELAADAHGCPLSSVDVLDVLVWPLDPGTPPFDRCRFKAGRSGLAVGRGLVLGSAGVGSSGRGPDGTSM